jgi:hypothetical protein
LTMATVELSAGSMISGSSRLVYGLQRLLLTAGLADFLNALLSIVAIAVGVLVGSGFAERLGRAKSQWRGI